MKEILDILRTFERVRRRGEVLVLASVVRSQGSTYRRPGARALFTADGGIVGLIGGGCLEIDLQLQAAKVRDTGRPSLIRYDNTSSEDIVWGLGLGCNGKVDVLLEPVGSENAGPLDFIARCLNHRISGVLATVIECKDPARLASHALLDSRGQVGSTANWDDSVELLHPMAELQTTAKPRVIANRDRRILIEPVTPPLRLVLVGCGPDAAPLVAIASGLGWRVELFDHREAFARPERFPDAASVSLLPIADTAHSAQSDRRTAVILMTHHFLNDFKLLKGFLESDAPYLGVLGPKARLERLLEGLEEQDCRPTSEQLQKLRGPIGLDIGAESPQEIALSIAAEIQAFFAQCDGMPLMDKAGPIHV